MTQPKFKRGQTVKVSNFVVSLTGKSHTEYSIRQIVAIRLHDGRYEYQMIGAYYFVAEHRLTAIN